MNLKKLSQGVALALCTALALPAAAAPRLIGEGDVKAAKTTYSLFYVDFTKVALSRATAQANLQARLDAAGQGVTPCLLTADINANNINCGNGLMRLGADLFSTTFGSNFAAPAISWTAADRDSGLDRTSVEYAINARSNPAVGAPQDIPRTFHIRFNKRIAQFGFVIDPFLFGDATTPADEGRILDGLQFIVNGQATAVRDLTQELRGNFPFIGVEDPHGFTEVTVISSGSSFVKPDRYTLVPLSNF